MIPATALRARLGRLHRELPDFASEPPRTPELAQLLGRIERMRIRSRTFAPAPTPLRDIATLLGGRETSPGLIQVDRGHPFWQPFGRQTLGQWIAKARAAVETGLETSLERLLFIDTETSGLAGGTGTIAWMVGIARIEAKTVVTRQYVITGFAAERDMLAAVRAEVTPGATLVSFNGKSFDLPLLATRLKLNRLDDMPPACHLDLLHTLRRRFKSELPDCRLKTLEEHVLGLPRDNDVPGSEGPAIWNALLSGTADAQLESMARHNRLDLLGMAALLHAAV